MATDINTVFLQLSRRAELLDKTYLVKSFVDAGPIFTLLSSIDHQILFGRRGTGKTHALAYLDESMKKRGDISINIDMRTLGSSGGIYSDPTLSLEERATRLVIDTLSSIQGQLLDYAIENDKKFDLSVMGGLLDKLADSILEVSISGQVSQEEVSQSEQRTTNGFSAKVSIPDPAFGIEYKTDFGENELVAKKTVRIGSERHRIHFGSVRGALVKIISALSPKRVWLFLDEWSEVPLDLQPFLADMLRRIIFSVRGITTKIAAIEQRCAFRKPLSNGSYIGIEVGADIATSLNLDEYMVFDNNAERAKEFFRELIYRHVQSSSDKMTALTNGEDLIRHAFTQRNVFDEFVRASEGVPRDAINILSLAAQKADNAQISTADIRNAAKTWYNRAKESAVSARPEAYRLLRKIVDEVIAHRRARAFMIRSDDKHPLIDFLFDARILHIIKHGVSAHDQPGVRFIVYAIDYGCYVDLMNTTRAPQGLFEAETEDGNLYISGVPENDYRSIRRAILDVAEIDRII